MEKLAAPTGAQINNQFVIILVEPIHPGNVGAAVRAMNNHGLTEIRVVSPQCYDPQRVRWMAPGCDELVANIQIFDTLEDALIGITSVVAATARHRRGNTPVLTPLELADSIVMGPLDIRTAVLFGREDCGLSTDDVSRASAIVRIPTSSHASLNLGQSVLLITHALFNQAVALGMPLTGRPLGGRNKIRETYALSAPDEQSQPADVVEAEPVIQQLLALLDDVEYTNRVPKKIVTTTLRGAFQQASPTKRQLHALRGMLKSIERKIRN